MGIDRFSSQGGHARARKLSAQRRTEIARMGGLARMNSLTPQERSDLGRKGFRHLVAKRFAGNRDLCIEWLKAQSDRPYWGTPQQKFYQTQIDPSSPVPSTSDPSSTETSTWLVKDFKVLPID